MKREQLQRWVVTAEQMRIIEAQVFAAGMPVAALMEKVAGKLSDRISTLYPPTNARRVGVLVGPGHNGGDALVVARELLFRGYEVTVYCPFSRLKDLTAQHFQYAQYLGIPCQSDLEAIQPYDLWIDGLFGFGLERALTSPIGAWVEQINQSATPIVSIDIPSGLHTDTGRPLGSAIRAHRTLCLGLWKLGLLQDCALEFVGEAELIDFDLPLATVTSVLQPAVALPQSIQRITPAWAISGLPLPIPAALHKYQRGHTLLICGSRRYSGAALLAGLAARASGVGLVTIAVPDRLKPILSSQLPEALIWGCPETACGAIADLPPEIDLNAFDAIACGPGLTLAAATIVPAILEHDCPLILDADALNILARDHLMPKLSQRKSLTLLTPHLGEFRRLFPNLSAAVETDRISAASRSAAQTGTIVLLKGARVTIADPQGNIRINPTSTPALARGGSGDVLTGLLGGLMAENARATTAKPALEITQTVTWWHAQAGILAADARTELGVDAFTLTQFLIPALRSTLSDSTSL